MKPNKAVLSLLSLFVLVSASVAQQGPSPREVLLPKRIFFALQKPVSEEIKLTPSGRQRVIDAFQGSLEVAGEGIRLTLNGDQNLSQMEQDAMDTLSDGQRSHLLKLWVRHFGALTLLDKEVAKKVGVTVDERKQIDSLADKGGDEILTLMNGDPKPGDRDKINAIRETYAKSMSALLTPDQAKILEELAGK
jgi:hypothetical protein